MAQKYDIGLLLVLAIFVIAPFTSMVPLVTYDEHETTLSNHTRDRLNTTTLDDGANSVFINDACKTLKFDSDKTCVEKIFELANTVNNGQISIGTFESVRSSGDLTADCKTVCYIKATDIIYEGSIGIFDASRACQITTIDAKSQEATKQSCHKDKALEDKLEDLDNIVLGDIGFFTCDWNPHFAGSIDSCAGTRNGWCDSNQGVGFAMMIAIVVFVSVYIAMECCQKYNDKGSGFNFDSKMVTVSTMLLYLFVGIGMLFIAERARYFADANARNDCGFDQPAISITNTSIHARGYSELGSGSYLYYVGFFFCVLRLIMMTLEMRNPEFKPRVMVWVYLTLVTLAILAITMPFVTITTAFNEVSGIVVTSLRPFSTSGHNPMFGSYMDGTCEIKAFDNGPYDDCKSDYKSFCHETKAATITLVSLTGIGLIFAFVSAMRPTTMDNFKMVNYTLFGFIALMSVIHSIWATYMVWHPLTVDAEGDISCGFNFMDGSDFGGMSLAATWLMFVLSTICIIVTRFSNIENGEYKIVGISL